MSPETKQRAAAIGAYALGTLFLVMLGFAVLLTMAM